MNTTTEPVSSMEEERDSISVGDGGQHNNSAAPTRRLSLQKPLERCSAASSGSGWGRVSFHDDETVVPTTRAAPESSEQSGGNEAPSENETETGAINPNINAHSSTVAASMRDKLSAKLPTKLSLSVPSRSSLTKSMWSTIGRISDRASEVLEDARLTNHGKEDQLYESSAERLSVSTDPVLQSLGERMSLDESAPKSSALSRRDHVLQQQNGNLTAEDLGSENGVVLQVYPVEWEGLLSKRSEWLRRWEKQYFVLKGKTLTRFPSKEVYAEFVHNCSPTESSSKKSANSASATASFPSSTTSSSFGAPNMYHITGCKKSSSRKNAFTIYTEGGKTLVVAAKTPVERVVWMQLILEALAASPDVGLTPLDVEEFYAMLVVLYTAHSGKWSTEGDMGVTLPPVEEQVFSRFVSLLSEDIIFTSNYPPSVPFSGSFREVSGFLEYIYVFSTNTVWKKFKLEGMTLDGNIGVACGREELENYSDYRSFTQNWVHKFTFSNHNGKITKIEMNGDVVAASAVFKVPGAATTLKLPQEFAQLDLDHSSGVVEVKILGGKGFRNPSYATRQSTSINPFAYGSANSTSLATGKDKETWILFSIETSDDLPASSNITDTLNAIATTASSSTSSSIGSLSVPNLTRKFGSFSTKNLGLGSATNGHSKATSLGSGFSSDHPAAATGSNSSTAKLREVLQWSSGPPKREEDKPEADSDEIEEEQNWQDGCDIIWNSSCVLNFRNARETCWLMVEGVELDVVRATLTSNAPSMETTSQACDFQLKKATKLGASAINLAPFITNKNGDNVTQWFSLSNSKGDFCGQILLSLTCTLDVVKELSLDSSSSAYGTPGSVDSSTPHLNGASSAPNINALVAKALFDTDGSSLQSSFMSTGGVSPALQHRTAQFKRWKRNSASNLLSIPQGVSASSGDTQTAASEGPSRPRSATATHPNGVDTRRGEPAGRHRGWSSVHISSLTSSAPDNSATTGSIASSGSKTALQEEVDKEDGSEKMEEGLENPSIPSIHSVTACSSRFLIPSHYNLIKVCGKGAYGIVIAATNSQTGTNVAIKKVIDCLWHPHQLKQILREVRLMRYLDHPNVLNLLDLIPPVSYANFRDVYMVVDLMEMDLHRIIYSKEILSDDHIKYFLFQIMSGLQHMHSKKIIHRDLKPSNLLINSDCCLKICDFGLARSLLSEEEIGGGGEKSTGSNAGNQPAEDDPANPKRQRKMMTEYVVTRWYRAPELLLGSKYDEGVDLWAAGCIFAEMLGRKPLFPGRSYVHQLQLIINVLGVPAEHSFEVNPLAQKLKGRQLLSRTPSMQGIDTSVLFQNANPEALDLLWKMLVFDPEKRISVADALKHPYLASWANHPGTVTSTNRDSLVGKDPKMKFSDFDFEDVGEEDLKELMFREICHFHPEQMEKRAKEVLTMPESEKLPAGWIKRESRSVPGKFYYTNIKKGISTWNTPH